MHVSRKEEIYLFEFELNRALSTTKNQERRHFYQALRDVFYILCYSDIVLSFLS